MEKFYHNDFDDFIQEKADQYKMYPSDKVWKGIDRSLRSRKKWYWTGFVLLLSGISYLSVIELLKPAHPLAAASFPVATSIKKTGTPQQLAPFISGIPSNAYFPTPSANSSSNTDNSVISALTMEESGAITAAFDIPMHLYAGGNPAGSSAARGSLLIEGLAPLEKNEVYTIELSIPIQEEHFLTPAETHTLPAANQKIATLSLDSQYENNLRINWLEDQAAFKMPSSSAKRISWQLAFSPTVNYRKLTGGDNARIGSGSRNIPLALQIDGNINSLVNHKPALGFELGTHAFLSLSNRLTLKGGIQFNYSKYDIRAYRTTPELATISLNPSPGRNLQSLTSYTDIRNFGGNSVDNLKNQYYQFSLPLGLELKVLGNERLQFNIAGTIQPTYLLNKNSYLITTDYKNYTKAPSLVRRWNMNAGAEAFLSYNRGDVKWQIGPQFRYQLLSGYDKAYPIKEFLMEYGIKIGITKMIR